VLFEPTAYYALPSPPADKSVSAAFADYVQNLAQSSQVLKPETLETDWLQWWSALFRAIGEFWQQAGQVLGNLLNHVWQWLKAGGILLVTGLLALAAGIYFFRAMLESRWRLWRIRRLMRRKPPCDVFAIYASLENYFAVRGHPRNTAWTVAEYGHRLQQEFPSDAEGIGSILAAFSQARYGHVAPDAAIISAAAAHLQGLVNNNN
jgi:hypothetical protein